MNNILNAQEAFAALQKGKTVLCRYAGDGVLHADKDFSTLDQMPATVFGLPNYEFCIHIETIELAGISFTKPLTLDELVDDTDVFVINPNGFIHQYTYTGIGDGLVTMVEGGFAQRDFDNAKLQYEALCKLLGGTPIKANLIVAEKKKKTTGKRPAKKEIEAHKDVILDAIATCVDADEVESVCSGIEQYGFNDDQIQAINTAKCAKLELLAADESDLFEGQLASDETVAWNAQLQELLERVPETKTIAEAKALTRYTKSWTEEQRQPLLHAISSRLLELEDPQPKSEPSLMVKIQTAPDLTTLDALEIDVGGLDPIAQPDMMRIVNTRRLHLESAANDEGQAS